MFRKGYTYPKYLTEGMEVIIPFIYNGQEYGLVCKVTVASGDAGRVVNDKYGVNKWVDRYEMAVPINEC